MQIRKLLRLIAEAVPLLTHADNLDRCISPGLARTGDLFDVNEAL